MHEYIFIVFLTSMVTAYELLTPGLSPIDPASKTTCNKYVVNTQFCDITCKIYGTCYQNSKQEYIFIPLETCPKYCTNSGCSDIADESSCVPNADTIRCTAEGIYPDPFDCRRSLYCSPGTAVSTCTDCGDRYYNSVTGTCDEVLENDQCPSSVMKVCPYVGYTTAVSNDRRFYYTCMVDEDELVPQLSKCSPGKHFNTSSNVCLPDGNGYYPASKETCTNSTLTSTTTTSTTFSPVCQEEGNIPDPKDCHKYYICDANLNLTHMICLPLYYFDTNQKKCVFGECSS